jgi:hypothetical protein
VNVNLSRDVVRTVFNDVDLTKFGQFSRIGCFEAHRLFVIHFHVRTVSKEPSTLGNMSVVAEDIPDLC